MESTVEISQLSGVIMTIPNFFAVLCPRCQSADVSVIIPDGEPLPFTVKLFKCNKCHAVFNQAGKLTSA
jgi:hypothetical protein